MPPKNKKNTPNSDSDTNIYSFAPADFATPALDSQSLRMSYRILRGEQGVLTFEPYKSLLLPHWRFRTEAIAQHSSSILSQAFAHYVRAGDFVGADMTRKFVQMGMTRAKRYANHRGGRKYDRSEREVEREGGERKELPKSEEHEGREEKARASEVFREVWRRCLADEGYVRLREEFLAELREWERDGKEG